MHSVMLNRQREDLIQEALLRLFRVLSAGKYRGESKLQRYVRSITRNLLIDQLRKNIPSEVTDSGEGTTGTDESPGMDERLVQRDIAERLLEALPGEDGRLLVEAYVVGNSYAVMARERGVSQGALKVRVFRAARRARQVLSDLLGQSEIGGGGD